MKVIFLFMNILITTSQFTRILSEQKMDKLLKISYKYNPDVVEIQKELVKNNYYIGKFGPKKDGVDGKYGPFTIAAHEAYLNKVPAAKFNPNRLNYTEKYVTDVGDSSLTNEFNFHKIPDGKNNYRSAQIPAKVLDSVIKKYKIKTIIRLNGDGKDGRHVSSHPITTVEEERGVCEQNGCELIQINPHSGYVEGKGYVTSVKKVSDILKQGNVLIHCAHGADRTGGMVGGYLKNSGIMTDPDELWDYTTQYNSWRSKVRNGTFFGSGYDLYAECFYPLNDLKNKDFSKKSSFKLPSDTRKDVGTGKWNSCRTCMSSYSGNLDHCGFQAIERFEENYGSGDYGRPEPPKYFENNHKSFDRRIVGRITNLIGSQSWNSMPPKFQMQLWSFMYNADSGGSDGYKWLAVLYLTANDSIQNFDGNIARKIRGQRDSNTWNEAVRLVSSTKDWGSRYNKFVNMLNGHYQTLQSWRPLAYKNTWSFRPTALNDMYDECAEQK